MGQLFSDDAGNTDVFDVQYVVFNVIAMIFVVVQFGRASLTAGFPDIPEGLVLLTGGPAAVYLTNKFMPGTAPAIFRQFTGALRGRRGSRAPVSQKALPEQEILALALWLPGDPHNPQDFDRVAAAHDKYRAQQFAAEVEALRRPRRATQIRHRNLGAKLVHGSDHGAMLRSGPKMSPACRDPSAVGERTFRTRPPAASKAAALAAYLLDGVGTRMNHSAAVAARIPRIVDLVEPQWRSFMEVLPGSTTSATALPSR